MHIGWRDCVFIQLWQEDCRTSSVLKARQQQEAIALPRIFWSSHSGNCKAKLVGVCLCNVKRKMLPKGNAVTCQEFTQKAGCAVRMLQVG
ncbi:hypothetical protein scyTo_0000685 [Scyliorhinus torazame]|uniref:Uncharacterized protein n=1 Tax=Scyliorhinus torazame TaxID=75743 RepID=A0A401P1Z5_SCYTO|nr:hypothetical protein [Scyliorhinus torazame]